MGNDKLKGHALVLGATSDLAVALARAFAADGYGFILAGRDEERLRVIAGDLQIRHNIPAATVFFDALNFQSHEAFYHSLPVRPDIVFCVFGFLGDQPLGEKDWSEASLIIDSNYTGAVSILNIVANDFEKRGAGTIVGISSVAGERGRQSNYLYGSAKAGFTAYLSGLRNRLARSKVHVVTVKPGFMRTRMTEGMRTPAPLTASPDVAAAAILKATKAKRNIIYVLPVWQLIMLVIRMIPEPIFKKLRL